MYTGYALDDTTKEELTLLRAAIEVQNEMKVAKVFLPRDLSFVELLLELFLDGKPLLSAELLERSIGTPRMRRRFYAAVTPREEPRVQA